MASDKRHPPSLSRSILSHSFCLSSLSELLPNGYHQSKTDDGGKQNFLCLALSVYSNLLLKEKSASTQLQHVAEEEIVAEEEVVAEKEAMVEEEVLAEEKSTAEEEAMARTPIKGKEVYGFFFTYRNDYLGAIREHFRGFHFGAMGWGLAKGLEDIGRGHTWFKIMLHPWVATWAATEPEDMERLSKDQRQSIIRSLGLSCVQEDWDVLVSRFPPLIRELVAEVFLEALVMRQIHTQFFENPFWYLDGKIATDDQEGDTTFAARLQHLYRKFQESMSRCPFTPFYLGHLLIISLSQQTHSAQASGRLRLSVWQTQSIIRRPLTPTLGTTTKSAPLRFSPGWWMNFSPVSRSHGCCESRVARMKNATGTTICLRSTSKYRKHQ